MAVVMPSTAAAEAAMRAGADLRLARERLGWDLGDIATRLRIHLCHLEALELGNMALLPGSAYAVGYVRAYASILGLDPEAMVRRFKAEAADIGNGGELSFPVPMADRRMPAGAVVLLGLVLSIAAYAGWYRLSGDGHLPSETDTAIPERLAPLAEQAVPPSLSPSKPVTVADVPARSVPQATLPTPAISPTSAAASPIPDPLPDQVMAPVSADQSRITLHASADAWIQVKDRSGVLLLNRTLKAGETWPVPRQDNLLLTTGNAGGTDLLLDGLATPSLGASGTVRRDMPLDPDLIKDGKLAAPLAPQLPPRARQ